MSRVAAMSSAAAAVNSLHRFQQQQKNASDIELEEGWASIHMGGIVKLQKMLELGNRRSMFGHREYVGLYTTVYEMCTQKAPKCWTHQLYERFEQTVSEYLLDTVLPALERARSGDDFVRELVRRWEAHLLMRRWMGCFFGYLNRFYIKRHNKRTLEDVCILRFKELVYEAVRKRATSALLDLIERGRAGEGVDHSLLRRAIDIYVVMGMGQLDHYAVDFQAAFLESTASFYAREAARLLQSETCPSYLAKVDARLRQERARLDEFLHASSRDRLFEVLHQQLLIVHQEAILCKAGTGCKSLLKARATDDLTRMYRLYAAVPASLPFIARLFKELVISVGEEMVARLTAEGDNGKYIEELLAMHDRFYELTTTCFDDAGVFHFALKDAFEHIVNMFSMGGTTTAELLASHCDKLLQKGAGGSDALLDEAFEKVVKIFTYLTDKDMFSDFYRKQLAKRLLLAKSSSDEAERAMIGKLKLKCGAQFTSKFEGMINDTNLAGDAAAAFQEWLRSERAGLSLEVSVQVLTTGFWPTYKSEDVALPAEMTKCMNVFQRFYDTRTAHRRLAWIHHLGVATVAGNYAQPVDIVCSTYQAVILMLFNQTAEMTIEEVGTRANLSKDEVKQQLRPLVMGQYKLLVKEPAEGFSTAHRLRVNAQFTSPKRLIKIPLAASKTSDEERSKTTVEVTEDRVHAVEAAIVRLMKARQTMEHAQLCAEVAQQMLPLFRPDPKAIKKRIDDLITREYLERDAKSSTTYRYLA